MNKYCIILILLVLCTLLSAQEITISTGAHLNYFSALFLDFMPTGDSTTFTHFGGFGPYVDFTYARFGIFYSFFVGGVRTENGGTEDIRDAVINFLNFYLVGKYPFSLGDFNIWPCAGMLYTYCVDFEIPDIGPNPPDKSGLSDIHILVGVGLDFQMDNIIISPHLLLSYNLMPSMYENTPSGVESY